MYQSTYDLIKNNVNAQVIMFQNLSQVTDWALVVADHRLFNFPGGQVDVPDMQYIGHYRFSGYRCPTCGKALYKTTFPEGIDPQFVFNDQTGDYVQAARIFTCPDCLKYFAVQEGQHLNDVNSAVVCAEFNQDQNGLGLYNDWFVLFNDLGSLTAKRSV